MKFLRQQVLWPQTSKPLQPTRSGIASWESMPLGVLLSPFSPGKTPVLVAPPPNFVRNSTRMLFIHVPAPEFMPVTGLRNFAGSQQRSQNYSNELRNGYLLVNTCIVAF